MSSPKPSDNVLEEFISEFAAFYSFSGGDEQKAETAAAAPSAPTTTETNNSTTAAATTAAEADLLKEFLNEFVSFYSMNAINLEAPTASVEVAAAASPSSTASTTTEIVNNKSSTTNSSVNQQQQGLMEEFISEFISTYTIETPNLPNGDIERVFGGIC